jgi:hypothetical protein
VEVNNPDYFGLYGEPHDSPGARHRMCVKFYLKAREGIPGLRLAPTAPIRMLGDAKNLPWHQDGENVVIEQMPHKLPCRYAWFFKIRKADVVN